MTAITADRKFIIEGIEYSKAYPLKATTGVAYMGGLMATDSAGNATSLTDIAAVRCVGVARKGAVNTGAAGAVWVECIDQCVVDFAIDGAALDFTDYGKTVFGLDNATVTDATNGAQDVAVGSLIRIEGGRAFVLLGVPGFANA